MTIARKPCKQSKPRTTNTGGSTCGRSAPRPASSSSATRTKASLAWHPLRQQGARRRAGPPLAPTYWPPGCLPEPSPGWQGIAASSFHIPQTPLRTVVGRGLRTHIGEGCSESHGSPPRRPRLDLADTGSTPSRSGGSPPPHSLPANGSRAGDAAGPLGICAVSEDRDLLIGVDLGGGSEREHLRDLLASNTRAAHVAPLTTASPRSLTDRS